MIKLPLELLVLLDEGLISLTQKEALLLCRYKHKVILIELISKVYINIHESYGEYIWTGFGALGGTYGYKEDKNSINENYISVLHWSRLNGNRIDIYIIDEKENSLVLKRPLLILGVQDSRVNHVLKLIKDPVSGVGYQEGTLGDLCMFFQTELTTYRFLLEGYCNIPLVVLESIDLENNLWSHQILLVDQMFKGNRVTKLEINYTNSDIKDKKALSQYLINTHKSIESIFKKGDTKDQGKELSLTKRPDIHHMIPFDTSPNWDRFVRLMKSYGFRVTSDIVQHNFKWN